MQAGAKLVQLGKDILRGVVIGVANIIPGVSGGTMMVSMGIYDTLIYCITHLFKQFKKSVLTLLPYALGMLLGIFLLASLLEAMLESYPLPINTAFIGLIFGGISPLLHKINKKDLKVTAVACFVLFFALIIVLAVTGDVSNAESLPLTVGNVVLMLGVGAVAAATMIVPGISGSMVLMLLGYYTPTLNAVNTLKDALLARSVSAMVQPLGLLVPFGIGVVAGIFGVAKLIEWLLVRFPTPTYCAVLGLVAASPIAILLRTPMDGVTWMSILISLLTFAAGFVLAMLLARGEKQEKIPVR